MSMLGLTERKEKLPIARILIVTKKVRRLNGHLLRAENMKKTLVITYHYVKNVTGTMTSLMNMRLETVKYDY